MRFSIKYKLPLLMLVVFILYTGSLLYYRNQTFQNYRSHLYAVPQKLDSLSSEISSEIIYYHKNWNDIEEQVEELAKRHQLKVSIQDIEGQILLLKDYRDEGVTFNSKSFTQIDSQIDYIITVSKNYNLADLQAGRQQNGIIRYSLFVLFIMLLFLVFYLHHTIVKPLTLLKRNIQKVSYRSHSIISFIKPKNEIGDLAENFEEMVKKLEEAHEQQIDMMSSISHDLKTPLTSIRGYVERLLMKNIGEERRQDYYKIIYKKAQDIERLLEDLSEFVQDYNEVRKMQKQRIKLEDFYNSICNEYTIELDGLGVDFQCIGDIRKNLYIEIDEKKIRRVFANLISNSLKYCIHPIKIKLSCAVEKGSVYFTIEDNGQGIPEKELKNIFNKFYRVDKSRSLEKGGIGLGLAICKNIVENHQGTIKAYNNKDGGLSVVFQLPIGGKNTR